jgi:hypothetical protein
MECCLMADNKPPAFWKIRSDSDAETKAFMM